MYPRVSLLAVVLLCSTDLQAQSRPAIVISQIYGGGGDDIVVPLASGKLPEIRLGSLTLPSRIYFSTRASRDSPFFRVRDKYCLSGQSLAEQYEFMVLQRG